MTFGEAHTRYQEPPIAEQASFGQGSDFASRDLNTKSVYKWLLDNNAYLFRGCSPAIRSYHQRLMEHRSACLLLVGRDRTLSASRTLEESGKHS